MTIEAVLADVRDALDAHQAGGTSQVCGDCLAEVAEVIGRLDMGVGSLAPPPGGPTHVGTYRLEQRIERLKQALGYDAPIRRLKEHLAGVEAKNAELRRQITQANEALCARNIALDAQHHVWCDGGCEQGVHRRDGLGPGAVTEEVMAQARMNMQRLERWWTNRQGRLRRNENQ